MKLMCGAHDVLWANYLKKIAQLQKSQDKAREKYGIDWAGDAQEVHS